MMKQQDEIRLGDVFHVLLKHRLLIIILSVCGLVVGIVLSIFSYLRGEMSRTYAVTSAIAVTSQTKDGLYTNKERTPNSTDITLAENMTDSVIYVLKSDKTLNAAIQRLSLVGISVTDIYKNLEVKKYGSTQIVEMTLYWRNAEEGVEILGAINSVAPSVLAEVLQIGNVSVVNNPKSQYRIGGSVNATLWVIMVIAGFALGCGISVCELLFRPKLIRSEDITEKFDLKLIGELPEDKHYFSGSRPTLNMMECGPIDEAFISMGRILEYDLRNQENHVLCVTASSSKEGTSSIAAGLAFRLSEMEKKVLLIDLNVKNPMLSTLLQERVDYYHSLNGLYFGDAGKKEAIHSITQYFDLLPVVIQAGRILTISPDLVDLLKELSKGYDYTLIDIPAIGQSSNVLSLRELTDQILFVMRTDSSTLTEIGDSVSRLQKAGFSLLGVIANGIRTMDKSKDKRTPVGRSSRRKAVSMQKSGEGILSSSVVEGNRVLYNTGLEQNGVLDDSIARSYEEYRNDTDSEVIQQ